MAALDEGALICDFAQIYRIYDWRALPARYAGTLARGLPPESRIMLKLSGLSVPINTMILATIADACRTLVWHNTKDAKKGRNKPKSLFALLTKEGTRSEAEVSFGSGADFLEWREKMLKGGGADT